MTEKPEIKPPPEVLVLNLVPSDARTEEDISAISIFWKKNRGCRIILSQSSTEGGFFTKQLEEYVGRKRSMYIIFILSATNQDEYINTFQMTNGVEYLISDLHDFIAAHLPTDCHDIPKLMIYQFYETKTQQKMFPALQILKTLFDGRAGKKKSRKLLNTIECYTIEPESSYTEPGPSLFLRNLKNRNLSTIHKNIKLAFGDTAKALATKYRGAYSMNWYEQYFLETEIDGIYLPLEMTEEVNKRDKQPDEAKRDYLQGMRDLDKELSQIVSKIKKSNRFKKAINEILPQNITEKNIKLLSKICEKLKDLSCWEIMHSAAQKGISLLEGSTTKEWQITVLLDFYLLSAEASTFMNKRDDVLKYLHDFEKFYATLPVTHESRNIRKEQYSDIKKRKDTLMTNLMKDTTTGSKLRATQIITCHGGEILTEDAKVKLLPGSVKSATVMELETYVPKKVMVEPWIRVSPILKFSPCLKLSVPAQVITKTWVIQEGMTKSVAQVYYRKSYRCKWELNQSVIISGNGKVTFHTDRFCEYAIFIKTRFNWYFNVKPCLFGNPDTKMLANRLVLNCSTCMYALKNEMGEKQWTQVCSQDQSLMTKINDVVEIGISDIKDKEGKEVRSPSSQSAKIDTTFLSTGDHSTQDFRLPMSMEGVIEFDHDIILFRQDEETFRRKHKKERVNLDPKKIEVLKSTITVIDNHGSGNVEAKNIKVDIEEPAGRHTYRETTRYSLLLQMLSLVLMIFWVTRMWMLDYILFWSDV